MTAYQKIDETFIILLFLWQSMDLVTGEPTQFSTSS